MSTHYPTVPVETVRQRQHLPRPESFWPLVLIVDDEPLITETLAAILNGKSMAVLTASNSVEALEIARLVPPDLLISDVCMPGMNGIELAVEVTRMVADCEVILFSGRVIASDSGAAPDAGLREFVVLQKPVHPADLLELAWEKLRQRNTCIPLPRKPYNPSLYDLLSSVRVGVDPYPSTWNVTLRHR